ncbi:hypothetical protein [Rhodohalobacter mucosus]|uniref:Outer membrane protein beta-barrel domain-containing protein n=1 Tax=Rhodohalobacter mucosus TaxID=2079485 RepID=A0A316TUH7_9BACT|nr:hypothetical protein [Rhodohalobacter mucosus]PWN07351.1 hypothetical protein DDZ15_03540 [Rhodohalobacter mucosus]
MNHSDTDNDMDPMEQLFREKAGEFDIEYQESDWKALEPGLDLMDAKAARLFRIRLIAAAAVFLIMVFSYFIFQGTGTENELPEQIAQSEQNDGIESGNSGSEVTVNSDSVIPEADATEQHHPDTQSGISRDAGKIISDSDPAESQLDEIAYPSESDGQIAQYLTDASSINPLPVYAEFNNQFYQPEIDLYSDRLATIVMDSPNGSTFFSQSGESGHAQSERVQRSRMTAGLVMSPDVTGVGSVSGFRTPGYKAGAILEYALTKRLSISLGVIQTEVNYRASASEYNPPYYWQPGASPSEIIATCLMLDLPVTLKYNLFNFTRSRIYSSATLSSYYMQNEDYSFQYSDNVNGGLEGYNENTNKAYLLSSAGISVGYEFDLNQNFSLRAEPFLRLPLREVGWGNARLYSMGTFISLNYRI